MTKFHGAFTKFCCTLKSVAHFLGIPDMSDADSTSCWQNKHTKKPIPDPPPTYTLLQHNQRYLNIIFFFLLLAGLSSSSWTWSPTYSFHQLLVQCCTIISSWIKQKQRRAGPPCVTLRPLYSGRPANTSQQTEHLITILQSVYTTIWCGDR